MLKSKIIATTGGAMKKAIGIILVFLLLANFVFTQTEENIQKKNEIQIKVGALPALELFLGTFVSAFTAIGDAIDNKDNEQENFTLPTISVEYFRRLDTRNAIGASVSWGTPTYNISTSENEKKSNGISYVSAMFKYRYSYLVKDSFYLFGGLGLGAEAIYSFGAETDSVIPCVALQGTPIGIGFGSDRFFGTAELTIGSEGSILTLGGGIRF